MPKRILPCYFPIMDPHPRAPLLPSLLQKGKKPSYQPFFLKPVKEGRARGKKWGGKRGKKSEPPSWISLHSPLRPPCTPPPPHDPAELKNALLLKAMSGVLIYGGGDDKSEELTHCAAKAAKLGSDLFTLPFPSLSLSLSLSLALSLWLVRPPAMCCNKTCLTQQHNGTVVGPGLLRPPSYFL